MPLANTKSHYGTPARILHWLTALVILTNIPLGFIANRLPYDTTEALAQKAQLFSYHKTLGVAAFAVALLRILWALTQTRPAGLHPDRRLETRLAEAVHWMLYISLVAVPLSGWIGHAASAGYAPILWPLGQGLPLVPASPVIAETAFSLHWVFTKLLALSIALHIAGALKHHLIDRDATLQRMWRGKIAAPARVERAGLVAFLAAVAIYLGAGALTVGLTGQAEAVPPVAEATPTPAATTGNWRVEEGTLAFAVSQMGTDVEGQFGAWSADITFDDATGTGSVTVTIDTTTLTLGTVTDQAKTTEFFSTIDFPTATFTADIAPDAATPDAYLAAGTLTLRGVSLPLTLPFTLTIDGDRATMTGSTEVDRRGHAIGMSYPDEASVGHFVDVAVDLTATRAR